MEGTNLRLLSSSVPDDVEIQSPLSIKNHLLDRRNRSSILSVRRNFDLQVHDLLLYSHDLNSNIQTKISLPSSSPVEEIQLIGCCKGLVCLRINGNQIVLFNPALKELKLLSSFGLDDCLEGVDDDYLEAIHDDLLEGIDDCLKDYWVEQLGEGFGVSSTDDFKVALIYNIYTSKGSYRILHLYTSSTDSWRYRHVPYISGVPDNTSQSYCANLFFNNACHWDAKVLEDRSTRFILSFDLNTEEFREFAYPDSLRTEYRESTDLTILEECLAVVANYIPGEGSEFFEIWIMKEYGVKESWMKHAVINHEPGMLALFPCKNDEWLLVRDSDGNLSVSTFDSNTTLELDNISVKNRACSL